MEDISPADTDEGFTSKYNDVSSTNNEASPYSYRESVKKSIKEHKRRIKKIQVLLNLFIKKYLHLKILNMKILKSYLLDVLKQIKLENIQDILLHLVQ